jgi:hypothetical protein
MILWAVPAALLAAEPPTNDPAPGEGTPALPSPEVLDARFTETMNDVLMTGYFTTDGRDENQPLQKEQYLIKSVRKLRGELWLFQARWKYGDREVTLPLPLTVKWAGDTPVITLTDLTIPKLGTFTARVLIHGDRYAGTWQHGDKGGHLFGTITKPPPATRPAPAAGD